jgi:hypothetical protein
MSSTQALQTIQPDEWATMSSMAHALVKTKFLPQAIQTPEQALAIIMTGRELGIPPMASFSTINVIQGKPTVSPQLMLALINRSGQLEDMKLETGDNGATCTMKRRGRQAFTAHFGPTEASAMNLSSKDNYKKQAPTMYQWRAVAMAARAVFPDVVLGLYTPDEMGANVTVTAAGEMLVEESPTQTVEARRPSAEPVVTEGDGTPAADERAREILVNQILSVASDCGIERGQLDAMVNKKFRVADGLDSCGGEALGQVLEGLKLRRDEVELQAQILSVVAEQGSAGILDEHLAAEYEGRPVDKLKLDELRDVLKFLTDDAPVF